LANRSASLRTAPANLSARMRPSASRYLASLVTLCSRPSAASCKSIRGAPVPDGQNPRGDITALPSAGVRCVIAHLASSACPHFHALSRNVFPKATKLVCTAIAWRLERSERRP
jgi:hypothetical protein